MSKKMTFVLPVLVILCVLLVIAVVINLTASPGGETKSADGPNYPAARRVAQVDVYHGVQVADPYRWLEEMDSEETRSWMKAEDDLTVGFCRDVPGYHLLRDRIEAIRVFDRYGRPVKESGRTFLPITPAGKTRPVLYLAQKNGERMVLIDPEKDFDDEDLQLRTFWPSPDGKLVAYAVSQGQSSWRQLRIFDVEKKQTRSTRIEGMHAWGSGISWTQKSDGFFYDQFDQPDEADDLKSKVKNARLMYHQIGTEAARDKLIYSRNDRATWLYGHGVSMDGRYLVITGFDGGSVNNIVLYKNLEKDTEVAELIGQEDAGYTFVGNHDETFWFLTDFEAPARQIISLDITNPARANWQTLVPAQDATLQAARAVGDYFVAQYVRDARPSLRQFKLDGTFVREIGLPAVGGPGGIGGKQLPGPEFIYSFNSLVDPTTVYTLELKTGKSEILFRPELAFRPEDFEIRQVFYKSKDGTRIPMFIAHKNDVKPSSESPLFMYGYGAWGWSAFPWFQPHILAWLEMGGIYALPGIRGGGEYGEAWHQAGIKRNKQTGIDDYIAAAEWLVTNGFTSKDKIVANGGSASGVMPGAAMVQRPDLFGAIIIDIPSLDLIRFTESPGGKYLTPEYGDPSLADDFEVLFSYSPYHNLKKGVCYPPVMVMVGERDQTAVPMHGYKFIARLQHLQACDNPALLKVMWGAGHNYGTTQKQSAESWADAFAFLARTLELDISQEQFSKL